MGSKASGLPSSPSDASSSTSGVSEGSPSFGASSTPSSVPDTPGLPSLNMSCNDFIIAASACIARAKPSAPSLLIPSFSMAFASSSPSCERGSFSFLFSGASAFSFCSFSFVFPSFCLSLFSSSSLSSNLISPFRETSKFFSISCISFSSFPVFFSTVLMRPWIASPDSIVSGVSCTFSFASTSSCSSGVSGASGPLPAKNILRFSPMENL